MVTFGPDAGGWVRKDTCPRQFADLNEDDREDGVAFGYAGVFVACAGEYLFQWDTRVTARRRSRA